MQRFSYPAIRLSMVETKSPTDSKMPRSRKDGRKSLLVYLDAGLIKDLKRAALDDDRNVYDIVEEISRQWLERRAKRGRK
jgi:hypothetical protein